MFDVSVKEALNKSRKQSLEVKFYIPIKSQFVRIFCGYETKRVDDGIDLNILNMMKTHIITRWKMKDFFL